MTPSLISQIHGITDLPAEFCNDPEGNEWHAIWYGYFTIFDREPMNQYNIPQSLPPDVQAAILKELHYYKFGRVLAIITMGIVAVVALKHGIPLTI